MTKLLMITLLISFPVFGCDSNADGVEDNLALITTQLAILESHQLRVNLKTPKQDAIKRLKIGDFRLLSMATNPYNPASEKNSRYITEEIVCMLGERFIEGAGNPIESEKHSILSDRYFSYAILYNDTILESWREYLTKQ